MRLGALEAGVWETRLAEQRRLADGSVLACVPPVAQPGALSRASRRVGTHHLLPRDR